MVCIICEGELAFLGRLGRAYHYRCVGCGMEQHSDGGDVGGEELAQTEVR